MRADGCVFIFWQLPCGFVMVSASLSLGTECKLLMIVFKSSCQVITPYKPWSQINTGPSPNPLLQLCRSLLPPPCSFSPVSPRFCTFDSETRKFSCTPTSTPWSSCGNNWRPISSRKPLQVLINYTIIYFPVFHHFWGWVKLHSHWRGLNVVIFWRVSSHSKVVLKIHNPSVCIYK